MTRCIENIDLVAVVIESHYGRSHGNTALFFDLHKVGRGGSSDFVAFHGSRGVNRAAEEQ